MRWALCIALMAVGCGDGTAPNGHEPPTNSAGTDGTGGTSSCPNGYDGCPCFADDTCNGELVCDGIICAQPEECADGLPGCACDRQIGSDMRPTCVFGYHCDAGYCLEDVECSSPSDCAADETCVDDVCTDLSNVSFWAIVERFTPDSCDDGVLTGTKDLYFEAFDYSDLLDTSPVADSCPGTWSDFSFAFDGMTLRLVFWNENLVEDEMVAEVCWRDDADECTWVPTEVLHDGEYSDATLDIRFVPILRDN